ncbi:MAG: sugar phosphate isomerase/epimerase [Clostridiales bacterium]|nr:sugar phosphate isomerase/epimerase [Clostridiales bacterium]
MEIGIQLYTLRSETEKDYAAVLSKVGAFGYAGVELAGWPPFSDEELGNCLTQSGLKLAGAHISLEEQESGMERLCARLQGLGCTRISIPWIPAELLEAEEIDSTAVRFNELQKRAAACGMELSYHNHGFEFEGDRFERLAEKCPNLKWELDTFWVHFSGRDPLQLMREQMGRIQMIHIKDMVPGQTEVSPDISNPPILEGCVDILSLLHLAEEQGLPWAMVEMDYPGENPLEAVRRSRENLRREGY